MTTNNDLPAAKRFLEGMCGGVRPTPVLAAVSGGLDSMCLLHLLSTWGREHGLTVTAAHFNHRLRGEASDRDEAFVRDWCQENGVPFVSGEADVAAHAALFGQSIEEAARALRYAFLEEQKRALGCTFILTAHHADDSAETQLLNLLRGTGLRGLTGIPAVRGDIARPFLGVTREQLAAYAKAHDLPHVEDETNLDPDAAARNLIRLRVMPLLKELNPRAVENMARTAELLSRDEEVLERMAEALLRKSCRVDGGEARLDAESCLAAEPAVLNRAVLEVLARMAGHRKDLSARHGADVCALLRGAPGKTLSLPYGLTARREEDALVICRSEPTPEEMALLPGETAVFGRWQVRLAESGPGLALKAPEGARWMVTAWRRDDRMTLPGSRGEWSFKRLCAERGITPAERDTMPVLRVDGEIAAAPGIGVDVDFMPQSDAALYVTFDKMTEEKIL